MIKWMGVILVVAGCAGFGCSMAAGVRRETRLLGRLRALISYMECQLRYQLTPLPSLCRDAPFRGVLGRIMENLAKELEEAMAPDVRTCMASAIRASGEVPPKVRRILLELGETLGRFDLTGQLQALEEMGQQCETQLREIAQNQEIRLRSYTTLGLCAGAAAAILLL